MHQFLEKTLAFPTIALAKRNLCSFSPLNDQRNAKPLEWRTALDFKRSYLSFRREDLMRGPLNAGVVVNGEEEKSGLDDEEAEGEELKYSEHLAVACGNVARATCDEIQDCGSKFDDETELTEGTSEKGKML
jgi:hypothetical protein